MKITKVGELNSYKAQLFLEYFKSMIRNEDGMLLGTGNQIARFNNKGQLETTINCFLDCTDNKRVLMV